MIQSWSWFHFWVTPAVLPFWHQGPVSWKTVFPQTGGWGWFGDDSRTLHLLCTIFLLWLHQLHLGSPGIRSQTLGTSGLDSRIPHWEESCFCLISDAGFLGQEEDFVLSPAAPPVYLLVLTSSPGLWSPSVNDKKSKMPSSTRVGMSFNFLLSPHWNTKYSILQEIGKRWFACLCVC